MAFTALVMLGGCKKNKDNSDKDSLSGDCLLMQTRYEDGGITETYTYDDKRRLLKWAEYDNVHTYTYTSDKIIENVKGISTYTNTYSFNAQGRISSVTFNGENYAYTYFYTYNADGHLSSIKTDYGRIMNKYTWENGNLIKDEQFHAFSDGNQTNTLPSDIITYEYSADVRPLNGLHIANPFDHSYYGLSHISQYLGKQTKNLVVKTTASFVNKPSDYTYAKDNKGNIISLSYTYNNGSYGVRAETAKYVYDCK